MSTVDEQRQHLTGGPDRRTGRHHRYRAVAGKAGPGIAIKTPTTAARAFADAKKIEDGLSYMEPRYWYYPVGQSLGAAPALLA
ncbi:hypothetical protein PYH37_001693 [Sinorhizobium numidicum]|uniref:Uncharacterized protein n=1 Tax=Sinorhizobium numidicum TaxID=680248 RepID=A0ABY8CU81_9HYPH|nr:hypothetical protein [Sinorhizobium numidicum]WEX74292.1 hypothetical protein PYH37_001693 [Sinorhizobium numidicum]WEX80278.1 hypothetical protein PYH38_001694 [Sinorhizobium numidicum]